LPARYVRRRSSQAVWSRRAGLLAVPVAVLTTALHRFGFIDTGPALVLAGIAGALALLALVLGFGAMVAIWQRGHRGMRPAAAGLVCALLVLVWPVWKLSHAALLPPINDVTTDWFAPPSLDWAAELRGPGGASTAYPGRDFALRQREADPEIVPLIVNYSADLVFETARELAAEYHWTEIDAIPPDIKSPGVVHLVARTPVFGFPDDVAIVITRLGPEETRVDMRSASRFGRHDLGANAARIYGFLTSLATRLDMPLLAAPGEPAD
jgi:hypothetical protein